MDELVEALRREAPRDVLMPVKIGSKHPMFPHQASRWSWFKFDQFVARGVGDFDVCVILQDLCVIDVDSNEIADDLEEEFPVLKTVPMEQTGRGRHYWFRRSSKCDQDGYYDGAAQVSKLIDFKTRTSCGTGGVIMVAPSSEKVFIRPIGDGLVEIPDVLLRRIAVAKHESMKFNFQFVDELGEMTVPIKRMRDIGYFEPFLEGVFEEGCVIPVPVSLDEFMIMMRAFDALEDGVSAVGEYGPVAEMTADKLCSATEIAKEVVERGVDLWERDLEASWPGFLSLMNQDESHVVDFPENVVYEPIIRKRTDSWPSFGNEYEEVAAGSIVATADNCYGLPFEIEEILRKYPIVLAGGAPLGIVGDGIIEEGSDWDLFLYGVDHQRADEILAEICRVDLPEAGWRRFKSSRAWTFSCLKYDTFVVQIVLNIYERPEQVPWSFDIAPSQIAIYSKDGVLKVIATPQCIESIRRLSFPVDFRRWSTSAVARIIKYSGKGFRVFVPGVRHAFLKNNQYSGIGAIFYADRVLSLEKKEYRNTALKRVIYEIRGATSGYDTDGFKLLGWFKFTIARLARSTSRTINMIIDDVFAVPTVGSLVFWRVYNRVAMNPAPGEFAAVHGDGFLEVAAAEMGYGSFDR
jgi:hypothetical protein